jgi:hypothetical protein
VENPFLISITSLQLLIKGICFISVLLTPSPLLLNF